MTVIVSGNFVTTTAIGSMMMNKFCLLNIFNKLKCVTVTSATDSVVTAVANDTCWLTF